MRTATTLYHPKSIRGHRSFATSLIMSNAGSTSDASSSAAQDEAWSRVSNLVSVGPKDAVKMHQVYVEWDAVYDQDMAVLGYQAPQEAAKQVTSLTRNMSARILDFGCGTGLVAELLHHQGYTNIVGMDPVESLIEKSKKKKVYVETKVLEIEPTTKIPYENDWFDVVVSAGVFGPHGATQTAFQEVSRVLKPGGYFVNMIRQWSYIAHENGCDLEGSYKKFAEEGVWTRLPDVDCFYYTEKQLPGMVLTVQKK